MFKIELFQAIGKKIFDDQALTEKQKQLNKMVKEFNEGKNPISIVMEFAQCRHFEIHYETVPAKKKGYV